MICVIKFLGSNCYEDMVNAYKKMNLDCQVIHHNDKSLPSETKLVILPGGFSWGDYLRCGAIAARSNIIKALKKFIDNGGVAIGICNGFQILCESKILPGMLLRNKNLKFMSMNVALKVQNNDNIMLCDYKRDSIINLPIANGDGNYITDQKTLDSMKENNQIILKYTSDINGSIEQIAGICNKDKNVFALMPHPERALNIKSFNTKFEDFSSKNMDGFFMLQSLAKHAMNKNLCL